MCPGMRGETLQLGAGELFGVGGVRQEVLPLARDDLDKFV